MLKDWHSKTFVEYYENFLKVKLLTQYIYTDAVTKIIPAEVKSHSGTPKPKSFVLQATVSERKINIEKW